MGKAPRSAAGNNPGLTEAPCTVEVAKPAGALAGFPSTVPTALPVGPRAPEPIFL